MGRFMAVYIGVNGTANSFLYTAVKEICLQVKLTGVESGMASKYTHIGEELKCLSRNVWKCPFIAWALWHVSS